VTLAGHGTVGIGVALREGGRKANQSKEEKNNEDQDEDQSWYGRLGHLTI
jgi:hypothetical protein